MPTPRAKYYQPTNTPAKSVSPNSPGTATHKNFTTLPVRSAPISVATKNASTFNTRGAVRSTISRPQSSGTQIAKNMIALRRSGDFLGDVK